MSGIVNKIKDVLHHDKDTTSTTHSSTTHSSTTGSHGTSNPNSNVASATSNSTNHGGHDSNLLNKADPRVDSDRDGSRIPGQAGHSGVSNSHGSGLTSGSTNAGPHSSNLANKADPRFDSDRDGSHLPGQAGHTTGHSTTGHSSTLGSNHGTSNTVGPHSSDAANKLDPRVDSDNSKAYGSHQTGNTQIPFGSSLGGNNHGTTGHSGVTGSNTHGTTGHSGVTGSNTHGTSGFGSSTGHSTNAGPHSSNLANKIDPKVDSDLDGRGNRHGANTGGVFGASGSHATSGSGTAQNTSGPHNSDLLNKLDPRVDSDKDGSKTVGGNKTHA